MNKLLYGMMNKANLIPADDREPDPALAAAEEEAARKFRPNRAQRRAMAKMRDDRRWDKKLAAHYNIPKALVKNATRYGSSVEMLLSEHLQQGAIQFKPMNEDGNAQA